LIELKNVLVFQRSIEALNAFISEGNFRFSMDGLKFKALDPSQIVLVDYELKKNVFNKYDIEPSLVGLDLNELNKIMNRAQQNDSLSIDLTDSEMHLVLDGDLKRAFKLPLLDLNDEEVKAPKYSFDAVIKMNARMLKEALKDASLFSSSVVLKVLKGKFVIESGGASGNLAINAKTKGINIESKAEVISKYSLNFLQNIVKSADNDSEITLELKSDTALKASYNIGSNKIQFYLAHMIL
jgi:proliferating cell nuclear antigen